MRRTIDERDSNSLLKPAFHPWKENKVQEEFVKGLGDNAKSSWGIMYCGGSAGVNKDLREISVDYDIDLHIDSFAW